MHGASWRCLSATGRCEALGIGLLRSAQVDNCWGARACTTPKAGPSPRSTGLLGRPYWGRGFAFEAVKAVLAHAFNTLNWERAMSLIDAQNHRSIRLAQRLGERFAREVEWR